MPSLFLQATTLHLMFIEGASTLPIGERSGVTLRDADRQAEVASLRITLEGALESGESILVNATPVGGEEVVNGSVVLVDQRASLQHYQVSKKSVSHSQTQTQTGLIPRLVSFTNWFSLVPIPHFLLHYTQTHSDCSPIAAICLLYLHRGTSWRASSDHHRL